MTSYDIRRLALIFALQAEIEGMKAENTCCKNLGQSIAYNDELFFDKASELTALAYKPEELL